LLERFREIEQILFQKLIIEPAGIDKIAYGESHPGIVIKGRTDVTPMLNREINSGYWDHPLQEIRGQPTMFFISYFDWDVLGIRDNGYIKVQIAKWDEHPEVEGKQAPIETQCFMFFGGEFARRQNGSLI
jgi:hypothetical protein